MPELPEAETVARGLERRIAGRRIRRVRVHRSELVEPDAPRSFERRLKGRRVEGAGRRGKWVVVRLDDGLRWVTQLRMTGTFRWEPGVAIRDEPHLSLSMTFDAGDDGRGGERADGAERGDRRDEASDGMLRFFDVRRFARMRLLELEDWPALSERLGPEPLSPDFSADALARRIEGSHAPIRNVLLDQHRLAGVGNVYANEACHAARIDPRRAAGGLSRDDVRRLHRAIRHVLARAIERKGTSFSDFRDLGGSEGGFQNELAVYGRAGEPCPECGTSIERAVLAGRSAFYCPRCQT